MLPFDCYCNFGDGLIQIQSSNEMIGASNIDSVMDQDDDGQKPAEPSRSHKETERRRRQRINSHLSTLRSLLPNPTKVLLRIVLPQKTDKASLLAGVVHHVRQLRQQLAAFSRQHTDPSSSCSCSRLALADPEQWPFPGDSDEATLISCHGSGLLKVTLCCDDRPGLNGELARTFRAFHAKEIRAEMASSGGRAKLEVLVEWVGRQDEDRVSGLKRALEAVVENRARRLSYRNKQARTSYELS
ncbi:transcription factor bHLH30-like isoform X1 [Punica granatum]|uniref:Transcription factor bHLH30-like isoform X1 n=1 Tax=Punica granatum TaxID=22663 RepID=A0A6P8CYD0_PUNGR|nr:transcription factor bHLH30-like isoform X1 [Punica granatum]XP_031384446.1 transcription factor bHLH30-like isoform X1 [Punica granatum]